MVDADGPSYLLDNASEQAPPRFASLAAVFDPVTTAGIRRLRVGSGWRCWEVGAGAASIP